MPFNTEFGYVPDTVQAIIVKLIPYINAEFGTSYTESSFEGTNFYRLCYAVAQLAYENEVDTGEIYNKLQDYFRATNESIITPQTPLNGLIAKFEEAGFEVSFDTQTAGTLGVCVNVALADPDYATKKATIIETLALYTVAGLIFNGAQTGTYTFTNGQSFTFKFDVPTEKATLLRATIVTSANNTSRIFSSSEVRDIIDTNISEKYQLGNNFEPDKYLTAEDLPFAGSILLEWSMNAGSTWSAGVYSANYKDLVVYVKNDITVSIT